MPKFEFTDKQLENLKLFLANTTIKGADSVALVQLLAVLNNPIKEVKKEDKGENEK